MASTEITDTTCGAFRRLPDQAVEPDAVHRLVVGEDTALQTLSPQQAAVELGDPFATQLLLNGQFPRTAGEVLEAFERAGAQGEPLGTPSFFLLGEGSQIAFTPATASLRRNLRFLVALGGGQRGPDVLISAFHPDTADVELMAWDRRRGGFNFYRTVEASSGWVFAGNSLHAVSERTEGKGPFESHTSGNFLMKELRAPWIHWHSPDANVLPTVFRARDPLRDHPWFTGREPQGAFRCEVSVARPSIVRWTKARFASLLAEGPAIARPERILRQVLESPTVNLISSHTEGATAPSADSVDLPQTFFVDSEALTELLGMQAPPPFAVTGEIYGATLERFEVALRDRRGFERPGDAHFAFAVPERAFEDEVVLREAIAVGLVSERLAACLLMTDFPNPIFSPRRAALMAHVPAGATVEGGQSSFSQEMADAILAAADAAGEDSPEQEFAESWSAGENFRPTFDRELGDYYTAVSDQLATQEGFDAYFRLAESRRARVRELPIFESPLLFAESLVAAGERAMRPDGTVDER